MTVDDIKEKIELIKRMQGDFEAQHSYEDDLYEAVLMEIAKGIPGCDCQALAQEALKTKDLDFERWCA